MMQIISLCFLVLVILCPLGLSAQTVVEAGCINEDVEWIPSFSPYVIQGRLCVNEGARLVILPGVKILFDEYSWIEVYGSLIAEGVLENPIILTSFSENPSNESQWGLMIKGNQASSSFSSPVSRMKHVEVSYSAQGISLISARLEMEHVRFSNMGTAIYTDAASLQVQNSIFEHIQNDVIGAYNKSNLSLESISVSEVEQGAAAGIYGSNAELNNSKLFNIYSGIQIYDSRKGYPSSFKMRNTSVGRVDSEAVYNGTASSSVDVSGNWWGHRSGPFHETNLEGKGGQIYGLADIAPWLSKDPYSNGSSNVLFIPGIQASRLYAKGVFENQLWEPNRNGDVAELFLDGNGESLRSDVYTKDIIDEVNIIAPGFNVYKSFIHFMNEMVSGQKIKEWQAFPYDWRLAVDDVVRRGRKDQDGKIFFADKPEASEEALLVSLLRNLSESSATGAVSIVAHSNGGLVAKALLSQLQSDKESGVSDLIDVVDKLVLVAVPELGTPQAVAALLHGDGQSLGGGVLLNKKTARAFGENMPGAHGLLPSTVYFQNIRTPVLSFASSSGVMLSEIRDLFGTEISNTTDLFSFLSGELDMRSKPEISNTDAPQVLNKGLLERALDVHSTIDRAVFPGISLYRIIGTGIETLQRIHYEPKKLCKNRFSVESLSRVFLCKAEEVLERVPVLTLNGDGTVVEKSAKGFVSGNDYYFDFASHNASLGVLDMNHSHANIFESREVRELLGSMLKDEDLDTLTIPNISNTPPGSLERKRLRVSVHSPVSISLFDSAGRHTGVSTSTIFAVASSSDQAVLAVDQQIRDSNYLDYGHGKYISFNPTDRAALNQSYLVEMNGTGFGLFTFRVEEFVGDEMLRSVEFKDLPVNPLMKAQLSLGSFNDVDSLPIDLNGDGAIDLIVYPGTTFDAAAYLDSLRTVLERLCMSETKRVQLLEKIKNVLSRLMTEEGEAIGTILKDNIIVSDEDFIDFSVTTASLELQAEIAGAIEELLARI